MPFKSSLTVGLFSYHGVASPDNAKHLSSEMIFGKTSPTAFCSSVRKKRIFELKLLAVQSRMKLGIWIATGLPVHTEDRMKYMHIHLWEMVTSFRNVRTTERNANGLPLLQGVWFTSACLVSPVADKSLLTNVEIAAVSHNGLITLPSSLLFVLSFCASDDQKTKSRNCYLIYFFSS